MNKLHWMFKSICVVKDWSLLWIVSLKPRARHELSYLPVVSDKKCVAFKLRAHFASLHFACLVLMQFFKTHYCSLVKCYLTSQNNRRAMLLAYFIYAQPGR